MSALRRRLALTRLEDRDTPAGLDPTFGTGGTAVLDLGRDTTVLSAIIQPDGKIAVLAGIDGDTARASQAELIRLNPDGSRDTTFADNDVLSVPSPNQEQSINTAPFGMAFGRLSDGSYLVVSPSAENTPTDLTISHFNPDGSPAGVRTLALSQTQFGNRFSPDSIFVRPDGSLLLSYQSTETVQTASQVSSTENVVEIRRVTADGQLDATFGDGGAVTIDVGSADGRIIRSAGLSASPDGGVIITGETSDPIPTDTTSRTPLNFHVSVFAARLNADGTRDLTYGVNGLFTLPSSDSETVGSTAATAAAGGGLLVVQELLSFPFGAAVHRVSPGGTLDTGYGDSGTLNLTTRQYQSGNINGQSIFSSGLTLLPAADGGTFVLDTRTDGLLIQKLTAGGAVDTGYGDGGLAFLANPAGRYRAYSAVEAGPNGDLTVVGWQWPQGALAPAAANPFILRFAASVPTAPLPPIPTVPPTLPPDSADLTGDGVGDPVTVTGSRLQITDGVTGKVLVSDFAPYEASFTGGLDIAYGEFDGSGKQELVVAPDVGGGARIEVFEWTGTALSLVDNFFAIDDPAFRGGARVATGDLNGDGAPDLVVAAGPGGGPRVAVFDGHGLAAAQAAPPKLVPDFFAFPGADAAQLRNGASVAVGDVDGDGKADLVFGAGPGGAPRVFALSGALVAAGQVADAEAAPLANFFAGGDSTSRGGAQVVLGYAAGFSPSLQVSNPASGQIWLYDPGINAGVAGEPSGRQVTSDPPLPVKATP